MTKLTTEREVLQRAGQVFRRGDARVSRFRFVADNSTTFEVKRLCELVKTERSSQYASKTRAPGAGRADGRGR